MKKAAQSSIIEKQYELPDGRVLTLGNGRFRCPEFLFKPNLIGSACSGLDQMIYHSIMSCQIDLRQDFFGHIVLSGGNTMFEGIAERLEKELKALAPTSTKIKIIAHPRRKYFAWIGGSILASLSTFQEMCMTMQEYDEFGPYIVNKKF